MAATAGVRAAAWWRLIVVTAENIAPSITSQPPDSTRQAQGRSPPPRPFLHGRPFGALGRASFQRFRHPAGSAQKCAVIRRPGPSTVIVPPYGRTHCGSVCPKSRLNTTMAPGLYRPRARIIAARCSSR